MGRCAGWSCLLIVICLRGITRTYAQFVTTPRTDVPSERCEYSDIGFLIDSSGSIVGEPGVDTFQLMQRFVNRVIGRIDVGRSENLVGLVQYSETALTIFNLITYADSSKAENYEAVDNMASLGQNTNTALGLRTLRTVVFNRTNGDRPEFPNTAIVITDGRSNVNRSQTRPEGELLQGVAEVFVIGITNEIYYPELVEIASSPDNVIYAQNYTSLITYLDNIIGLICINDTSPRCKEQVDVVFVVDNSATISEPKYRQLLDFLVNVVVQLDVDSGKVRVAVIIFSDTPTIHFGFSTYHTRLDIADAITNLPHSGYDTDTAAALRMLRNDLFTERRSDAAFVAVVLTNGDSSSREMTLYEASEGQLVGITFLTVAADPWLDRYVLSAIASFPYQYNMIIAANYSILSSSDDVPYLVDTMCNS